MERGVAILPLHVGKVPRWLFARMVKLSESIVTLLVQECGTSELLSRLSDPFWFQAFGNVLGFDWHSSGLTTTVMGALKQALKHVDVGARVAGGKGLASRKTPEEIRQIGEEFGLSDARVEFVVKASKLSAKVDNAVLQDSYQLYQHALILTEKGEWVVVQQGMNLYASMARRYHWLGKKVESFVEEPHSGIIGEARHARVMDLTSKKSKETRQCSLDLLSEGPSKLSQQLRLLSTNYKRSLLRWLQPLQERERKIEEQILIMPKRINWQAIEQAMELKPANYEELLELKGIGPACIRALALVSHLIYGTKLSWRDPCKYSFAHGGKDGVPYPVRRDVYENTLQTLKDAINQAKLGRQAKLEALKRLHNFLKL